MITSFVVVTSFSMRSRNLGRAENKGRHETTHPCNTYERIITRNNLSRHISKQRATVRLCRSPSCFVVVVDNEVELCEEKNEGH
jgi:hypothetical protein